MGAELTKPFCDPGLPFDRFESKQRAELTETGHIVEGITSENNNFDAFVRLIRVSAQFAVTRGSNNRRRELAV